MEGYHLFQEKIKREVNNSSSNPPVCHFLQPEPLSGWNLYAFDYEYEEAYMETASFVHFSTISGDVQFHIEAIDTPSNELDLPESDITLFYE